MFPKPDPAFRKEWGTAKYRQRIPKTRERGPEVRAIAGTGKVAVVKAMLRLPHNLG